MKTNGIRGNLKLYERIENLEKENIELKEKVEDCIDFIRILEKWLTDTEEKNNDIDLGIY